jgi:hypothetical protein
MSTNIAMRLVVSDGRRNVRFIVPQGCSWSQFLGGSKERLGIPASAKVMALDNRESEIVSMLDLEDAEVITFVVVQAPLVPRNHAESQGFRQPRTPGTFGTDAARKTLHEPYQRPQTATAVRLPTSVNSKTASPHTARNGTSGSASASTLFSQRRGGTGAPPHEAYQPEQSQSQSQSHFRRGDGRGLPRSLPQAPSAVTFTPLLQSAAQGSQANSARRPQSAARQRVDYKRVDNPVRQEPRYAPPQTATFGPPPQLHAHARGGQVQQTELGNRFVNAAASDAAAGGSLVGSPVRVRGGGGGSVSGPRQGGGVGWPVSDQQVEQSQRQSFTASGRPLHSSGWNNHVGKIKMIGTGAPPLEGKMGVSATFKKHLGKQLQKRVAEAAVDYASAGDICLSHSASRGRIGADLVHMHQAYVRSALSPKNPIQQSYVTHQGTRSKLPFSTVATASYARDGQYR